MTACGHRQRLWASVCLCGATPKAKWQARLCADWPACGRAAGCAAAVRKPCLRSLDMGPGREGREGLAVMLTHCSNHASGPPNSASSAVPACAAKTTIALCRSHRVGVHLHFQARAARRMSGRHPLAARHRHPSRGSEVNRTC